MRLRIRDDPARLVDLDPNVVVASATDAQERGEREPTPNHGFSKRHGLMIGPAPPERGTHDVRIVRRGGRPLNRLPDGPGV